MVPSEESKACLGLSCAYDKITTLKRSEHLKNKKRLLVDNNVRQNAATAIGFQADLVPDSMNV